jgi:hypothetical protein
MKKINNFFDKANLLLVYPVMATFVSIITFFSLIILGRAVGAPEQPDIILIKISLLMGLMMGLPVTAMIYMMRKSAEFWKMAEEVGKKVDDAETKDELRHIMDNEFVELRKRSGGGIHYTELRRLVAIMTTKAKYIK